MAQYRDIDDGLQPLYRVWQRFWISYMSGRRHLVDNVCVEWDGARSRKVLRIERTRAGYMRHSKLISPPQHKETR